MTNPHGPSAAETAGATILVVDDETRVRALLTIALRAAGFATLEAADGIDALAIIERQPVSLVLVDNVMPGLSGPALIARLRERWDTRHLPIILVTVLAGVEDRVAGLSGGADDFVAKPVILEDLIARIRAQLRIQTAWSAEIERGFVERRSIAAAFRRVVAADDPDRVAQSLFDGLIPELRLAGGAILLFNLNSRLVTLASTGTLEHIYPRGLELSRSTARPMLARAKEGPWINAPRQRVAVGTRPPILAYLPLEGASEPFGILVLSIPAPDSAGGLASRLSAYGELSDMIADLLRPSVGRAERRGDEQSGIQWVIKHRLFAPVYQPIVNLADGAIVGYESLTRFSDGVAPIRRFADARRVGLGPELELATARAAMALASTLPRRAFLSLNVSPSALLALDALRGILRSPTRSLVIELTEREPIADYAELARCLADIPVQIAIDDAGSGYASLQHVLAIGPQYVKLDAEWMHGLETDPARQALVAAYVHVAREAGCQLVGEGIETQPERAVLLRLGVSLGQGYLFGRPQAQSKAGRAIEPPPVVMPSQA
jgi:EAL domain-containing protein (putative c-di-GMP-specific phosphodiesterase class I)/FixJ family two-component response regulator